VEIAFASRRLRALCENDRKAIKEFGTEVAAILRRRLADIRAATSISDLVTGNVQLSEDEMQCSLSVGAESLIMRSNHSTPPLTKEGKLDWTAVERVQILRVCGYE
jgi:plasmid maintenance system killer protein